ncbi:hypothetical protein V8C37DRAFT_124976 [Trichoderma ceciliae]
MELLGTLPVLSTLHVILATTIIFIIIIIRRHLGTAQLPIVPDANLSSRSQLPQPGSFDARGQTGTLVASLTCNHAQSIHPDSHILRTSNPAAFGSTTFFSLFFLFFFFQFLFSFYIHFKIESNATQSRHMAIPFPCPIRQLSAWPTWHRRNGAILTSKGVSIPRRHSVGWLHQLKMAPQVQLRQGHWPCPVFGAFHEVFASLRESSRVFCLFRAALL